MIPPFGCNNGLILAGTRVYYAMVRDGLFFRRAGVLNKKAVSTVVIRSAGYEWHEWQPRFHDHVIRNDDELNRIRHYIVLNPMRWGMK